MITINTTSQTVSCGNAGEYPVDITALPAASLEYIFAYGLKQVLNDARSSAAKVAEEEGLDVADVARAMVQKKLDALLSGDIRATSGRTSDPVAREAKRLANETLKARKIKRDQLTDEQYTKLVARFMDQAKANVAATASLIGDLGDIGL